jgi:hypothetical protein
MIGVAGAVAEALQKPFPEEFLEDEHYFWGSPDAMSGALQDALPGIRTNCSSPRSKRLPPCCSAMTFGEN